VHHDPPYNPDREPNHNNYNLMPILRSEHSRITASEGGGFGNQAPEGRGDQISEGRERRPGANTHAQNGKIEQGGNGA
jgi:hypothetical protein